MSTTWNSSDLSGLTLSNGKLTATGGSSASGVRGTTSYALGSSNLVYFELSNVNVPNSNDGLGFADSTFGLTSTSQGSNCMMAVSFGSVRNGQGGSFGDIPAITTNSVVGIAINFTLKKCWFRLNGGNWNNDVIANQNPVGNVGGIAIGWGTNGDNVFPAVCFDTTAGTATLNTAGPFNNSAPSGYSAWDNTPPLQSIGRPIVIF